MVCTAKDGQGGSIGGEDRRATGLEVDPVVGLEGRAINNREGGENIIIAPDLIVRAGVGNARGGGVDTRGAEPGRAVAACCR